MCLLFSSKVRSYIGFIIVRIRFWTEGGGLAYVTEESNATELCSNDKSSEINKKIWVKDGVRYYLQSVQSAEPNYTILINR